MATPTALPSTFVAGAILTAAQQNNLRGAFRVLQVVQYTYATQTDHNSSTYSSTGLTGAITPSANTNKVLVLAFVNGTVKGAENAANAVNLEIKRATTQIAEVKNLHLTSTLLLTIGTCFISVLDAPATTASTTYVVNAKNSFNGATVRTQQDNVTSTLMLAEISA